MANVLGNLIQEQGQGWAYDPQNGETLVRRWRGIKQYAEAYYSQLKGQAGVLSVSIDQEADSPIYVVTARYGQVQAGAETDGTIPYFWELAPTLIERSVFNFGAYSTLTKEQKTAVRKAFEENTENPTFADPNKALQEQLYGLLVDGEETYQATTFVLRLNRTHSSAYSNTISTTDVAKLYTYAQIQSEASAITSPISVAINSNTPSGGYWLKQAPVLTELSNRKLQLTQEWWWSDNWSTILYAVKA